MMRAIIMGRSGNAMALDDLSVKDATTELSMARRTLRKITRPSFSMEGRFVSNRKLPSHRAAPI